MNDPFNMELADALLGFNGGAIVYCHGISDTLAHEYAMSTPKCCRIERKVGYLTP